MYCGHARLCVCLSAAACQHYCTDPDVTWDNDRDAFSCALLDGFAIGAGVALLWQHNANPTYKLASTPRYDGIVRTRNVSECSVLALCLVVVCRGRLWFISPARRSRMDEHTPNQQSKDSWLYGKRRRRN